MQGGDYSLPLYTYPDSNDLLAETNRTPNLNMQIVTDIAAQLGLTFTPEKTTTVIPAHAGIQVDLKQNNTIDSRLCGHDEKAFAPIDLLDYIYAVLHSPSYRETYKEFLKIDFPRVPYPKNAENFWQLVGLGGQLRQTHLLEPASASSSTPQLAAQFAVTYPVAGDNIVTKLTFTLTEAHEANPNKLGKLFINNTQYFDHVPQMAYAFYIGGYQPAQKWLKDRKGRALNYEDIKHYQHIIHALAETDRLMTEIDQLAVV